MDRGISLTGSEWCLKNSNDKRKKGKGRGKSRDAGSFKLFMDAENSIVQTLVGVMGVIWGGIHEKSITVRWEFVYDLPLKTSVLSKDYIYKRIALC